MNKEQLLLNLFLFVSICGHTQPKDDTLRNILENSKLAETSRANIYRDIIYKNYFSKEPDSAYAMALRLVDFIDYYKLKKQKADASILLGDIEHLFGNNTKAIRYFENSLSIYTELNEKKGQAMAYKGIGVSYGKVYNLEEAKSYYLKALELSRSINDTILISKLLIGIGNTYLFKFKSDESIKYYQESLTLSQLTNNVTEEAIAYVNLSDAYAQKKDFETSKNYIFRAIRIGDSLQNYNILSNAYKNLSRKYLQEKKFDSMIIPSNEMLKYAKKMSSKELIDGAYYLLYEAHKNKRNFDSTIKYLELRKKQRTTIDDINSVKALEKIKIDNSRVKDSLIYLAKELKAEMINQKEKTNLTLAWASSLSAVSLFAFLIFRNSKHKQRKAEQERQQRIEEKEKILKDLELSTIDAMIQGQEKERQRLADDLHDSVGATLTAAKMQFEYLIKHQNDIKASEELIKKTSTLLENAYVEIRSMAHLKNSGVMAKNGLLPAVEKLSSNASGLNGLSFEVKSYGLEQRLENSIEITVFRIIQELTTNIIKHAQATKGTIHLTNHKDSLNIMVEDNGKGFNPSQITKTNKGMGISSIDKRVEHLGGSMTIESENNKGTTVIIDIPL